MTLRFFGLNDAVAHAATITNRWTDENGNGYDLKQMTEFFELGEAESGIDHTDDKEFYYLVADDGSVGLTHDAEQSIYWAMYGVKPQSIPTPTPLEQNRTYAGTFCTECGKLLTDNAAFCPYCGAKRITSNQPSATQTPIPPQHVVIPPMPTPPPVPAVPTNRQPAPPQPVGDVGFSTVMSTREFQEAARKQRRSVRGCLMMFIFAPLILCPIIGYFGDDAFVAGLYVGAMLTVIFAVFYLLLHLYDLTKRPWEGVVEKKREGERIDRNRDGVEVGRIYDFYTFVRTTNGRKKTIHESIKSRNVGYSMPDAYNYFHEGDRIRYFGAKMGLTFPYEKYDKRGDRYRICVVCAEHNEPNEDRCHKCKAPLL